VADLSMVCMRGAQGPSDARAWVRARFGDQLDPDTLQIAELIVSELVTNAIVHTDDEVELCIAHQDRQLRIEVTDGQPDCGAVTMRTSQDWATDGRGLRIVDRASRAWGCTPNGYQKIVWAELDL
jgi:anti-sigma regulatory factor (Ser/Thr protein kinase)